MDREVTYTKAALKVLARMPTNTSRLIRAKVRQFAIDPPSLANNVTAMKGGTGYVRMRVGDWRVIIDADTMTVLVIDIGPRGGIYD